MEVFSLLILEGACVVSIFSNFFSFFLYHWLEPTLNLCGLGVDDLWPLLLSLQAHRYNLSLANYLIYSLGHSDWFWNWHMTHVSAFRRNTDTCFSWKILGTRISLYTVFFLKRWYKLALPGIPFGHGFPVMARYRIWI